MFVICTVQNAVTIFPVFKAHFLFVHSTTSSKFWCNPRKSSPSFLLTSTTGHFPINPSPNFHFPSPSSAATPICSVLHLLSPQSPSFSFFFNNNNNVYRQFWSGAQDFPLFWQGNIFMIWKVESLSFFVWILNGFSSNLKIFHNFNVTEELRCEMIWCKASKFHSTYPSLFFRHHR